MSFLRGPLSKKEIASLMKEKKTKLAHQEERQSVRGDGIAKEIASNSQPILSEDIDQFYYATNSFEECCAFVPYLLANATVKYYDSKRHIDHEEEIYYKYYLDENMKDIDWDETQTNDDDFDLYDIKPRENSSFSPLPDFISELKNLKSLEKEFSNHLYHDKRITLYRYPDLKLESELDESLQDFNIRALDILKEKKEEAIEKITKKFEKKRESFERKHKRALEKLAKEESDVSHNTTNAFLAFGMTILDALSGRSAVKRSTTSKAGSAIRSASRMYREKDDVTRAQERIGEIEEEFESLELSLEEDIEELGEEYMLENYEMEEFFIKPRRSDIFDLELGILWESR
jgi:hypothetical protein